MRVGTCLRSLAGQQQRLQNRQNSSRVRVRRLLGLQRVQYSQKEAVGQETREIQEVAAEGLHPGGLRVEWVQ